MRLKALALCLMTGFAATAAAQDSTQTLLSLIHILKKMLL